METIVQIVVPALADHCQIELGDDAEAAEGEQALVIPLIASGVRLGKLRLLVEGERRFRSPDVRLAEDLAGRAAMALENARHLRDAETAIRARDEFVSIAAHEMKTPIATLQGYAEMILRGTNLRPEQRTAAFSSIARQCGRLATLVQRLLELSRLQVGQFTLHRRRFDLGRLTTDATERMRVIAGRQQLIVRAPSVLVDADPDRIDQVLTNLIENAVKFSPEGRDIVIDVSARGNEAVVAVADQGVGIAVEQQPRVFDRFHRAHEESGMGIGLWISREIVLRHGGRVSCESSPGRGSLFTFSLPLVEAGSAIDAH